jgi:hypothetical protein
MGKRSFHKVLIELLNIWIFMAEAKFVGSIQEIKVLTSG